MSISVPTPYSDPGQYPTKARLGYSTSLQRGEEPTNWDGTLLTVTDWNDIGEVRDLTPFDLSRDTVTVTNHRSPNFSEETIPALITPGSASFDMNFVPELFSDPDEPQGGLFSDFQGANKPWRVVFAAAPDATGAVSVWFLASLTSYSVTVPVADAMQGSFELTISGGIEWHDADGDIIPFALAMEENVGPAGRGGRSGGRTRSSASTTATEAAVA
jgi:hypothetical protein